MNSHLEQHTQHAQKLLSEGKSIQEITSILRGQINSEEEIVIVQKQLEYDLHIKKSKNGKIKLLIGISLLGINFIITCIHFHSNLPFSVIMYSFTSVGALLLFWGVYDIFN